MRKFVAACCCAIVGLEVLIFVPLVTCLVVLGVVGGMGVEQVAMDGPPATQAYFPAPPMMPPPLNPTNYSGPSIGPPAGTLPPPIAFAPPSCPSATDCPGGPAPSICEAPEATVATLPPPISPQVEVIAELRETVGSPLAESSLAGDAAQTRTDSIAALERIAATEGAPCPTHCEAQPHSQAQPTIVECLQAAADQLYVKAQSLEADGNFDRADQLRGLAREIRREIGTLRGESGESPRTANVKAASYDEPLDEPAKIQTDRHPKPSAASPLQPARAELVEYQPGTPQLIMVIPTGAIIEEVEEEVLRVPNTPENPAP